MVLTIDWIKRILAGLGLIILLFLVLDFNSRMVELTRLTSQFNSETIELDGYLSEKDFIENEIAYATSKEAVEKWAREQGRYTKPGDHPIIPLPDPDYVEQIKPSSLSEFETKSLWELWNSWLFGDTP